MARQFASAYSTKHGTRAKRISAEALRYLKNYDFPGNVRELANIIERAAIVANGSSISVTDLPEGLRAAAAQRSQESKRPTLAEVEANYLREVLALTNGNKAEAARILGISRKNLYERLARESKGSGEQKADVGDERSEIGDQVS